MPVIINQTEDRVLLRFNSGLTRTMGPHEVLEVEHVEVKGNTRIQRLAERRRIAIEAAAPQGREGGGRGGRARAAADDGEEGGEEEGGGAEPEGESPRRRAPRLGRRKNKADE